MRQRFYQNRSGKAWPRVSSQVIYLPGAIILLYGFWLFLTV